MTDTPKTKAPRRSDTAIAAEYARRSEAARVRPIKATAKYKALHAANEALGGVDDDWCSSVLCEAVNEASRLLAIELNEMLEAKDAKP